MTTFVDLTTLTFPGLRLRAADAGKLRGFFARAFGDKSVLFHNHIDQGGFRYGYTNIQYKVLRGIPTVIGVAEGAKLLLEAFADIEAIDLEGQTLPVNDKELRVNREEAGVIDGLREYRLATPLFLFNQDNYGHFRQLPEGERPAFLSNLVRSHLVTALRGIGCTITPERRIMVLPRLNVRMVTTKNNRMQMYTGTFTANVALPPALGIGKSVSKGFGTVLPI